MDLYRVRTDGTGLEQLTEHMLDVAYPTPLDDDTVLYSARDHDGAGPWLWALDVPTKISRRASIGLEKFASVASSADGKRLVTTVQKHQAGLWQMPILDRIATEGDIKQLRELPGGRALSPRFGGRSLFYLSSGGSGDGLWRFEDGQVSEIWRGSDVALLEPASVSPDGDRVALLLRGKAGWHLHTLNADGTGLTLLTDRLEAQGTADWSPDGQWIVTGGALNGVEGLYKIPIGGGDPVRIVDGKALNPIWSPKGDLIVYAGPEVQVMAPLLGVRPDGSPVQLPEIELFFGAQRARFLPDGSGLVYMQGHKPAQDFWILNLNTFERRQLSNLSDEDHMWTFDVTPDGSAIVFDRISEDSDIVLIELE
jgi:dipeptidyl aminopeptidase/acylaminoacyl peptidase